MAFNIPNYPVLDSPFDIAGSMAKGIAMKLAQLQAQTEKAKLPWASDLARAEAASKLAYANSVTPQMAAKILENKQAFYALTPTQQSQVRALAQAPLGGNLAVQNILNNIPNPLPQQQEEPGLLDKLLSVLPGFSSGDEQPTPLRSAIASQVNVPSVNYPSAQTRPYPKSTDEVTMGVPAQEDEQMQEVSPMQALAKNTADMARLEAKAKEQGTTEVQTLKDLDNSSAAISDLAQQQTLTIKEFLKKYEDSKLTGKVFGRLADWGPDAAQLPGLANQMAASVGTQLFGSGSNLTDAKLAAAQSMKINPQMPAKAVYEAGQRLLAGQERASVFNDFVQTAKANGLTNAQDIKNLWYRFNRDYPFYDPNTMQPLNDNTWQYGNYAVSHIKDGKVMRDTQAKSGALKPPVTGKEVKARNPNEVIYERRNGKLVMSGGA